MFSSNSGQTLKTVARDWLEVLLLCALEIQGQKATEPDPVTSSICFCAPAPKLKPSPRWTPSILSFPGSILGCLCQNPGKLEAGRARAPENSGIWQAVTYTRVPQFGRKQSHHGDKLACLLPVLLSSRMVCDLSFQPSHSYCRHRPRGQQQLVPSRQSHAHAD